jgi:hypothetical protein
MNDKDWNFPKMHLRRHALDDIREKGASKYMSTKPYEKMHGKHKKIYMNQTNFKNTATQVGIYITTHNYTILTKKKYPVDS